jgi:hypothetical protein
LGVVGGAGEDGVGVDGAVFGEVGAADGDAEVEVWWCGSGVAGVADEGDGVTGVDLVAGGDVVFAVVGVVVEAAVGAEDGDGAAAEFAFGEAAGSAGFDDGAAEGGDDGGAFGGEDVDALVGSAAASGESVAVDEFGAGDRVDEFVVVAGVEPAVWGVDAEGGEVFGGEGVAIVDEAFVAHFPDHLGLRVVGAGGPGCGVVAGVAGDSEAGEHDDGEGGHAELGGGVASALVVGPVGPGVG